MTKLWHYTAEGWEGYPVMVCTTLGDHVGAMGIYPCALRFEQCVTCGGQRTVGDGGYVACPMCGDEATEREGE